VKKVRVSAFFVRVCVAGRTQAVEQIEPRRWEYQRIVSLKVL